MTLAIGNVQQARVVTADPSSCTRVAADGGRRGRGRVLAPAGARLRAGSRRERDAEGLSHSAGSRWMARGSRFQRMEADGAVSIVRLLGVDLQLFT